MGFLVVHERTERRAYLLTESDNKGRARYNICPAVKKEPNENLTCSR